MTTPTSPAGPRWSAMFSTVYMFPLTRACARERKLPTVHFIADHRGPHSRTVAVLPVDLRDSRRWAAPVLMAEVTAEGRGDAGAQVGRQG